MTEGKDIQKLRALLPHWIRHNAEHGAEYKTWVHKAGRVGIYLEAAADHCESANFTLQQALEKLGGPPEDKVEHEHSVTQEG